MTHEASLTSIYSAVREADAAVADFKKAQAASLDKVKAKLRAEQADLRRSVDELFRKTSRPGSECSGSSDLSRKDAIGLCYTKHALTHPKFDPADWTPPSRRRPRT